MYENINKKLFAGINFYKYAIERNRSDIEHFLNYDIPDLSNRSTCDLYYDSIFSDRCKEAINIIKNIMLKHEKEEITLTIQNLAEVESGIRGLKPYARDHVVHAMLTFFIGIYINDNFFLENKVEPFEWKLASLFHDIGYPMEVCSKYILKPFAKEVNAVRSSFDFSTQGIDFKVNIPDELAKLTNCKNSFTLIQECLDKWELGIDVNAEYDQMINKGEIRHGVISSLVLLNSIDLLYRKNNYEDEKFKRIIVPACAAIYIHDRKSKYFTKKINRSKAPIAFLLRLSDCLQEWERPNFENPNGLLATRFDIEIKDNQLIFNYTISDDNKIKNKIMNEILALEYQDIQINSI